MNENEIQKVEGTVSLTYFGGRDPIKEIGYRLQKLMPAAQRLTGDEAMAVAQLAFAHELDPFNGEVWGIKRQDTGQWYGVMVGIKGLRKSARREARKNGSDYFVSFHKVEPKKYDFAPGDIVYECHLRDVASFQAWSKMYTAMKVAGVDKETIEQSVGPAPVVIGIGKANAGEKSKMELHARAKKRAEADALKQKYDLNFGTGVITEGELPQEVAESAELTEAGGEPTGEYSEAEFTDIPAEQPEPQPEPAPKPEPVIDWKAKHDELWQKAGKLGVLKQPGAIDKYSARAGSPVETYREKAQALAQAVTLAELEG